MKEALYGKWVEPSNCKGLLNIFTNTFLKQQGFLTGKEIKSFLDKDLLMI